MKNILLLSSLFIFQLSFSQFELEHTYNDNVVTRVKLEIDGEKYYLVNKTTSQADFYNADHSFWKSIPLPSPPQNQFTEIRIWHVSQSKINLDNNIELIYSYYNIGNDNFYTTKIISENGNTLLTVDGGTHANLNEIEGLPTKLFVVDYQNFTKVYSFPELVLENTYQIAQDYLYRINLEIAGEKYYFFDKINGQARFFNADHSFWKNIDLPKPADAIYSSISFVADNEIGNTNLIKIGYLFSAINGNQSTYSGNIVEENGQNLLSIPNTISFFLSKLNGLNKIITTDLNTNTNYLYKSNVYNAANLSLEHQFESVVSRTILENSGEKYYTSLYPLNSQAKIYNADYSIWKTVDLPIAGEFYKISTISNLSENKFNSDNLVEFSCSYVFESLTFDTFFESRIINENGLSLLTVPGAYNLTLDEKPNLTNKILGLMYANGGSQPPTSTVYDTGILSTTNFKIAIITIAPNPVNNEFNIFSTKSVKQINIFNSIGKLVLTESALNLTKIELKNFANGIYLVQMKDDENNQTTQKIIISH